MTAVTLLQPICGVFSSRGKYRTSPLEQPETASVALFLGAEHDLHPDTDTEERRAGIDGIENRTVESSILQCLHQLPGMTDTGQHDRVGVD